MSTSSSTSGIGISTVAATAGYQSVGWAMADYYQRLYVNGFEKTNNTYTTVLRYTAGQLVLNGANRAVREVLFYNYDMLGYDFEKSAEDQLNTLQAQCSQGYFMSAQTSRCEGKANYYYYIR